jgi:protein TonB
VPALPAARALRHQLLLAGLLLAGAACSAGPFDQPPAPQRSAEPPAPSAATSAAQYRVDAARHVYARYPQQVLQGKVPAHVYAIVVTETYVDAQGRVLAVRVLRQPSSAREVTPWVVAMIRRAAPMPPLQRMKRARYVETWLVDRSGQFQLRALTEGQD